MLKHQKTVLKGVSDFKKLFRIERIKFMLWLNVSEWTGLSKWVHDKFRYRHPEILEEAQAKILIVEDDTGTLMTLRHKLKNKNYIIVSSRGEHSIENGHKEQPDIILLSLKLKNTTGLLLLKELKSQPDLRSIPVIILSEICTPLYWDEAYQRGAAAYLVNPIHLNYLGKRINKLLAQRQQEIPHGSEA